MSSYIVIEGNLTRDPAGGYGKESGKAYCHLDVAVNDRVKTTDGEWVDGAASYYRVSVFGTTAENATNSLAKGHTVLITGEYTVRSYTRTDGSTGIANEIVAQHLGVALTFSAAIPRKADRQHLRPSDHPLDRSNSLRFRQGSDRSSAG